MRLYRILPWDPGAAPHEKGGALFVPRGSSGRADNPDLYAVLYVSDTPEGAIAEMFGRLPVWCAADFVSASGRRMSLCAYDVPDDLDLCDLDDVEVLRRFRIDKPSWVVTRDRARTQAWSAEIFETRRYAGVQWWSYYCPEWRSMALWDLDEISLFGQPESLTADHTAVRRAASVIVRQIRTGHRHQR